MIQFPSANTFGLADVSAARPQIRQAVALGILHPGDQLPTVKEVVEKLAINPNTVLYMLTAEFLHLGEGSSRVGEAWVHSFRAGSRRCLRTGCGRFDPICNVGSTARARPVSTEVN